MILQELCGYYDRKAVLGEIAPPGFERKDIPFIIIVNKNGEFLDLKDTREKVDKNLVAKNYLVPKSNVRSGSNSWQITNLLWDHYGYVLGYPKDDSVKEQKKRQDFLEAYYESLPEADSGGFIKNATLNKYLLKHLSLSKIKEFLQELEIQKETSERKRLEDSLKSLLKASADSMKQLDTFTKYIQNLPETIKSDFSIQAILSFYNSNEYEKVFKHETWTECTAKNGVNLTFQLEGDNFPVFSSKVIRDFQQDRAFLPEKDESEKSLCLVSGEVDYIQRIHSVTPIRGGQATGKLVGFQKSSGFDSYGKEQAYNAPIGIHAQTAYTTALNTLSRSDNNRVFIGDTTLLFWSDKQNLLEQSISLILTKPKDDPDKHVEAVKQLYESIYSGKFSTGSNVRFFVLGLAPNSARISIRYWLTGTVVEFAEHIKQHFDDLEIVRKDTEPDFFALNTMLSNTVLEYNLEKIAPNLSGQVTESVLKGTQYPITMLHATIRRIRAEQHITRTRAAIIKACINRYNRFHNIDKEEIAVSLDKTNSNPAYLLGRLFAVLERVQYKALGIETIRERYYGAFSSTPVTVYPQLMKLKNHHLAKMKSGKNFFENLIGEIIDGLDGSGTIPRQFSLDDQGRFAVGYYHQRHDLRYKTSKEDIAKEEELENE